MSYHYNNNQGSSQRSSSQRTSNTSNQSQSTRPPAPDGFHYMPDGSLMSDAEHASMGTMLPNAQQAQQAQQSLLCSINDFYEAAGASVPGTNVYAVNVYLIPSSANYFGAPTGLIEVFEEVVKLQTGTPSQNTFFTFMNNLWNSYSNHNNPCNYLLNRYNHFNNQLINNTYSTAQTLLKEAKRDYFQYMYNHCNCGTIPMAPGSQLKMSAQTCSEQDIKNFAGSIMYPVYSSHPNQPMSVWYNNFLTFQTNMWSNYLQWGCTFFYNRIILFQGQLPNITNPYQISLKQAKIAFCQQMYITCGCGTPPPVAPPSISQLVKAKEEISFYEEMDNDDFVENINVTTVETKTINNFDLDLSSIKASGENRSFNIVGTAGANFKLEVKNEDAKYYNFVTNTFQTAYYCLEEKIGSSNNYTGQIQFPSVTDDDQYDIYLFAGENTEHANYVEFRFADGSLDLNSSKGSNSSLLQKVIYQYLSFDLTISAYSASGNLEVGSPTNATITVDQFKPNSKIPFTIDFSVTTNTKSYSITKQPSANDFVAFVTRTVGASPIQIEGENIYPSVTDSGTVNGAVTSGTSVTMDAAVASIMKVGDRITGNTALDAATVTVVSLDSTNVFTMSQAVAIADGITLSFSNQMNYRWPVSSTHLLEESMIVVPGGGIESDTVLASYQDTIVSLENTFSEETYVNTEVPSIDNLGKKPTITRGEVTTQEGNVVFSKQQPLALAGQTLKIGGYGLNEIKRVFGYEVELTDLAVTLSSVSTTTTSSVGNSTNVPVASRNGIANGDTVSGIGIKKASGTNVTVASGGGAAGAGTIVLSAAQTLENGITLTFSGSGQTATVTGNIKINRAGNAAQNIRLDVDRILSIT